MSELARPEAGGFLARVTNVPLGAIVVVDAEDVAVVVRGGEAIETLGPGRHELTEEQNPFVSKLAFGDVLDAELWFVRTTPRFGVKVGGPAGQILDPGTGLYVRPRLSAEVAIAASDPSRLIAALSSGSLPDEDGAVFAFVRTQILEAARRALLSIVSSGAGSLADLEHLGPELATEMRLHFADLDDLGLSVGALSNVAISIAPEEAAALSSSRAAGVESRVRAIHCPRCGAQARGVYCTQCGGPVNRTG